MSELAKIAQMIGKVVEASVGEVGADIGVFVFKKGPGLGMVVGGEKGEFNDKVLPFLKEAIQRLQQIVNAQEAGKLDMLDTKQYYTHNPDDGSFVVHPKEDLDDEQGKKWRAN